MLWASPDSILLWRYLRREQVLMMDSEGLPPEQDGHLLLPTFSAEVMFTRHPYLSW